MRFASTKILALAASLATAAHGRLLLWYPLNETGGPQAVDYSGSKHYGSIKGNPQFQGANGFRLDGVNDYVQLPNDVLKGVRAVTVSIDVYIRNEQSGSYFIWGLGNSGSDQNGNGYLFTTGDPLRGAITASSWPQEARINAANSLQREKWHTVTLVVDGGAKKLGLYLNGVSQGSYDTTTGAIILPSSIGSGSTSANYIGRSLYKNDKLLAGSVRNFRIWDTALSAQEIANSGNVNNPSPSPVPDTPVQGGGSTTDDVSRVGDALGALNISGLDNVRSNIQLPTSINGLQVTWSSSNPSVISNNGQVNRPTNGDVQVTLTATASSGSVSGSRSFTATVRRSGT